VTKRVAAFSALLSSAERLKLLTASHLIGGFYATHLIKIFNETARRKQLAHRAFRLSVVARKVSACSGLELLRELFRQEGAAILSVHAGTHWVLADGVDEDGRISVQDSGHSEKYRKDEVKSVGNDFDGVGLLPAQSALSRSLL
jgi:hypothetical protein